MSEPLNTYTLEHYLNFINDDTGLVRIDEPVGFDASSFFVEQEEGRYGRDISFAGGETQFKFTSQLNKYGHALDKLLEYNKLYGFNSEVQYILREGSTDYVVGQLDYFTKRTDEFYYFECSIIQDTDEALIKRRSDTTVKLFSDKNVDGDYIEPVSTSKVLIKSKPITQISEWTGSSDIDGLIAGNVYFSGIKNVTRFEINNTLSFLSPLNTVTASDFNIIEAQDDLSSVSIEASGIRFETAANLPPNFPTVRAFYRIGETYASSSEIEIDDFQPTSFDNNGLYTYNDVSFSLSDLIISRGNRLWLYFRLQTTGLAFIYLIPGGKITVTAQATSISSVSEGIRLIDAMKQVSKSINPNSNLIAPRFDVGGEWYDNFIFSGNMIRGKKTCVWDWEKISNSLSEFNSDYEIDGSNIFVGKYDDFYQNNDIGAFLIEPSEDLGIIYNERYALNKIDFKNKTYEQDRDEESTIDSVHTEAQWSIANKQVENFLDIEVDHIRDPFALESNRRQAISKSTSSRRDDDSIFMLDVVPVPPGRRGFFSARISQNIDSDGNLQLLNDGTFNWSLLGFNIGDTILILNTANAGGYEVLEFEGETLIRLSGANANSSVNDEITRINYPLTGVQFTNRTNEGFDLIEGIDAPDEYSNLLYTPKRNILNNWGRYLSTACQYNNSDLINQYFKNEPEEGFNLRTQFNGGDIIVENDDISQDQLDPAILTPRVVETKVLCNFSEYREFENKIKQERGFVRVYDNNNKVIKGYPKGSEFSWANGILSLTLEERLESQLTNITFQSGVYVIDEVGYPQDILSEIRIIGLDDTYIQLFDLANRPLINRTRFDQVSANGVIYDNLIDLINAIEGLDG